MVSSSPGTTIEFEKRLQLTASFVGLLAAALIANSMAAFR